MKSGEILVVFPNQIHAYFELTPAKGYVILLALDLFPEFHELLQSKLPQNPVVQAKTLSIDAGRYLVDARMKLKMNVGLAEAAAKGQLLTFLAEIFLRINFIDKPGEASTVKSILNYCMDHYTEPFTLEEMAKDLYLSKYYICHIFQERFNTNCKEFINQLRVEAACEALKKGEASRKRLTSPGFPRFVHSTGSFQAI